MKKQIYWMGGRNRHNQGPYESAEFPNVMNRIIGAEQVGFDLANSGKDIIQTYHVQPEGVTLRHESTEEREITITLYGSMDGIDAVSERFNNTMAKVVFEMREQAQPSPSK